MTIIDIPTEQTTAITDLLLGLLVLGIFIYFFRFRKNTLERIFLNTWLWLFGLLALASFIGAIAHGLAMTAQTNFILWQPINLALGMVIALFAAAVVLNIWGERAYRRVLPFLIIAAVIFYGVTVLIPGTFLTFIAYEAIAMLFALGGYVYLALRGKLPGAWVMAGGVLITIIAAVIQAVGKNGVVLFWGLDHNGVFHLVQMIGTVVLSVGIWMNLRKSK